MCVSSAPGLATSRAAGRARGSARARTRGRGRGYLGWAPPARRYLSISLIFPFTTWCIYWCVPAGMVVVRPEWLFDSVMAGEALGLGAYRHSPA